MQSWHNLFWNSLFKNKIILKYCSKWIVYKLPKHIMWTMKDSPLQFHFLIFKNVCPVSWTNVQSIFFWTGSSNPHSAKFALFFQCWAYVVRIALLRTTYFSRCAVQYVVELKSSQKARTFLDIVITFCRRYIVMGDHTLNTQRGTQMPVLKSWKF